VEYLAVLHEKLVANGIQFHAPPTISSDGGARVTCCHDPEGMIVELSS
jgi:predicted enzyme related to lactoylglutathione lyase